MLFYVSVTIYSSGMDIVICRLAQLSLGIAHNYGCIRSMKWCPSGGMAKLTPTIDNSEVKLYSYLFTHYHWPLDA